jgi:hypothetical protein
MWWTLYRIAYAAGLVWAAWYCFIIATNPANYGAGGLFFAATLGIAIAPCAALWVGRRFFTGRWL